MATGAVHGFPVVLTSFIGRAGPVRELTVLLEQYRLVTVTGPGGSGKTRLAGEVARRVAGRFEDGAWLVELAMVRDPEQVAAVVAAALGVREQPGVPAAGTLARVLARQQLLLVLDNCEHVLGAAAELCAGLAAACDDLRILATSREAMRVDGEARYRLGPLAVPDPDDLADAAGAEAEPVKLIETSGGWIYPTCLLRLDGGPGLVDPHPGRQPGGLGRAPEPVGACGEGVVEDLLAAGLDGPGGAVVDGGGGVQADSGMAVLSVVVGEEGAAEHACVVQGSERAGEDGAVFQRLEYGFRPESANSAVSSSCLGK